jgi:MFS family permease
VYSLTFGIGLVPAGRLGDAFGRRWLFVTGLVLFSVGALTAVVAPGIGWAVVGRCVQGFGAGVISAQVLGVIQDLFHGAERVRALAAYGAAASASAILGPLAAAGILAVVPSAVAWRFVLAISLPFIAATGVLALRYLPRADGRGSSARRTVGLDLPGIAMTAGIVVLVTIPVIDPGAGAPTIGGVVVGAALLVVATVTWERRTARRGGAPLFAPALVRSRGFVLGNAVAALWFGAGVAQSSVVTVFLLQGFGLSPLTVALVLVPGAAARVLGSWAAPGRMPSPERGCCRRRSGSSSSGSWSSGSRWRHCTARRSS